MSDASLPKETEVKFEVVDRETFEGRLLALGATRGPREFESNTLFDSPAGSLVAAGTVLRVRETEGRGLLTLKGPKEIRDGVKTRLEIETGVESASSLRAILEKVGFFPGFRYDKYRTVWTFADPGRPIVVVDETPLGLYAEIEGEETAIRELARDLGIAGTDFIAESYPALWGLARLVDPSRPKDMVFS